MKKVISLIAAIILVTVLTACGNTTYDYSKDPLPVQFGNVVSVEYLDDGIQSVVLTMNEPMSPEDVEREVYVSVVDYLFEYAPYLTELTATAYDQSESLIMSFTIPTEIISEMKEIEEQGNWGTEGFCGHYYFNHDAYNDLVARINEANE